MNEGSNDSFMPLSFIAESDEPGPLGHYMNYWTPVPTLDLKTDMERGRLLAKEALAGTKTFGNSRPVLLPLLEMQIRAEFSGLEIGFLTEVAEAARRGRMN